MGRVLGNLELTSTQPTLSAGAQQLIECPQVQESKESVTWARPSTNGSGLRDHIVQNKV